MTDKARRIDYSPDEYISGVAGVLKADEQGVYWMICTLIMSEGGPVAYNVGRLSTLCGTRPARLKAIVDRLLEIGKVTLADGRLGQKRALNEVERSLHRIESARENGRKGGRKSDRTQHELDTNSSSTQHEVDAKSDTTQRISEKKQAGPKAPGSFSEKLTTNYQLPTTNEIAPNGALSETVVSDRKRSTRKPYPDDFDAAWSAYPTHRNMSKAEALAEWEKLSKADRALVLPSIPSFTAYCRENPTYTPIHFNRYLKLRRFEGHAAGASSEPVEETRETWGKRLGYARRQGEWAVAKWGPMPGRDGCRVPEDMIELGDGQGWQEMRQAA